MRKIILTLIITLLFSVFFSKSSESLEFYRGWKDEDTYMLTYTNIIMVFDWMQTRHALKHARRFKEHNFILGENPSIQQLDLFIPVAIFSVNVFVAAATPKYRRYMMIFVSGMETSAVLHNSTVVGVGVWW